MKTLHAFCKEYGLPKSSVHRKAQEMNIDTSTGISKADCDRLLEAFGKKAIVQPSVVDVSVSSTAIVPLSTTVEIVPTEDLIVRKIQPQILSYDTTELDIATDLNFETQEFNLAAFEAQMIEQARQRARLTASRAKQVYAQTFAQEMQSMGKPQDSGSAA
jgi:hypothetical protein